ncbi:TPA: CoB--CoM heterodisulfide reductase iron-sulfur subunit A family protein [Candidatus Bathyarchaeota archaeon]|nr:CoB--CoM heterodisulfide reductase iron-sulfur subunit A family protein [Candidatus Bathyarchaeota archaeon]
MTKKRTQAKENSRIGVFICNCGINIGGVVDVEKVVKYAKTLPGVAYAESNLYTCSSEGTRKISDKIREYDLNRVVVASCTPRTHEPLFRETCEEAGLNKYLFEMANIREHCSWVHMKQPKRATRKAEDIVRMAVAKARLLTPEEETEVSVTPSSLVIGAGISGMEAALCLANQGFKIYLVEKEPTAGGMLRNLNKLYPTNEEASRFLDSIYQALNSNKNIELLTSTKILDVKGYVGNFEVTVSKEGKAETVLKVGTIIVATGAEEFKPAGMYGFGQKNNVITQIELERLLRTGLPDDMKKFVMIQCVGAMEEPGGREYCSRICCAVALKNALLIKEAKPDSEVYILYRQLQAYGREYESYYLKALEEKVKFINFLPQKPPVVTTDASGKLKINVYNTLIEKEITIESDLVVLSTPLVQHESGKSLSPLLKVPLGADGFFLEAHIKLRPVDFATDGIYVCGTAHSPKAVDESIIQAHAVASSASIPMSRGHVRSEAITAGVIENLCRGCGKCRDTCEFNAITLEEKVLNAEPFFRAPVLVAKVNEVVCKGCGSCAIACPTGAITMKHFTDKQILAEIKAAYRS